MFFSPSFIFFTCSLRVQMSNPFWRLNFKLPEDKKHWIPGANYRVRNPDSIQNFVGKEEGKNGGAREKERKEGGLYVANKKKGKKRVKNASALESNISAWTLYLILTSWKSWIYLNFYVPFSLSVKMRVKWVGTCKTLAEVHSIVGSQ